MKVALRLVVLIMLISGFVTARTPAQAAAACGPATSGIRTLQSGGLERTARVYIPASYKGTTAVPLVLSLHGFSSNAAQQESYSGWDTIADREGFIAAYPNGTGTPQRWYAGTTNFTGTSTIDDVQFFDDLLASFSDLCIDYARIYVTGLSNGGGMTARLACERADRIAAVGTVAGAYPIYPLLGADCATARAIPVITFHGTADPVVSFNGNPRLQFPPIRTWVEDWAKRNSCTKGPDEIFKQADVTGVAYTDCAENGDVEFYTIEGGGHTWPGSIPVPEFLLGKTTQTINASEAMWTFFAAHPLPQRP